MRAFSATGDLLVSMDGFFGTFALMKSQTGRRGQFELFLEGKIISDGAAWKASRMNRLTSGCFDREDLNEIGRTQASNSHKSR